MNYKGNTPGLGLSWYYEDGIANVVFQTKAVRKNSFEIDGIIEDFKSPVIGVCFDTNVYELYTYSKDSKI